MNKYLIIRLQGVMQSWGGHTFEDYRPTGLFPTRSGLLGLLGASIGIDRKDTERLKALSDSFTFAVRIDEYKHSIRQITDFHTVLEARKVDGKARKDAVISRREYLCDARYTAALRFTDGAFFPLDDVAGAIRMPFYTPFLGRRSCPLGRPLFDSVVEADGFLSALIKVEPGKGVVYSEENEGTENVLTMRDQPMFMKNRQFAMRRIFIYSEGGGNVSE